MYTSTTLVMFKIINEIKRTLAVLIKEIFFLNLNCLINNEEYLRQVWNLVDFKMSGDCNKITLHKI